MCVLYHYYYLIAGWWRYTEEASLPAKQFTPGLEVIKLEFILRLKINLNDWLLADTCPQAANQCALF